MRAADLAHGSSDCFLGRTVMSDGIDGTVKGDAELHQMAPCALAVEPDAGDIAA